jgi:protein TonB
MQINPLRITLAVVLISSLPGFAQESQKKVGRAEAESAVVLRVQPVYPPIARQLKIEGVVELEAVVNVSGEVEKVNILTGNPVLTKPAVEAVKRWKFKQFITDGKPVGAEVPVTISFKM